MCPRQDKNLDTKKVETIISFKRAVLVQGGLVQGSARTRGQRWYRE